MTTIAEVACLESLAENGVGVCLTDFSGAILCQNLIAANVCRNCCSQRRCGVPQFEPCRLTSLRSAAAMGTYRHCNQVVGSDHYDVYVVNNGTTLTKIIYCLTEKYAREMREFEQYSFTRVQSAVLKRLVQRATTGEIAREMSISEDTVRSHIKAIYRKISSTSRRILKEIRMERAGLT